jgi:hypothetical protein
MLVVVKFKFLDNNIVVVNVGADFKVALLVCL